MEVQPHSSWFNDEIRPEQVNHLLVKLMELTVGEFVETFNSQPDKKVFVHALYGGKARLKRRKELWDWFLDPSAKAGKDGKFTFRQCCQYLMLDSDVVLNGIRAIETHSELRLKIRDRLVEIIRSREL